MTRTLKVRLEMNNPALALKPDMYVKVEFQVAQPSTLTVPADAVLDAGQRKTVFVDRGNGFFEPRQVETGERSGDRIAILKGLKAGERVVTSGNFLIDSESQLKAAAEGMSSGAAPMPDMPDMPSMKSSAAGAGQQGAHKHD
jgi:multidrug efflux pump subunit AcrA (membrane-fusion protein)